MDADVLLQAGHQGRTRNNGSGSVASVGAGGTAQPEHLMTPIVADAAAAILRANGVSVVRVPGFFPKKFEVKLGLALHFDGSGTPCASGASVGYPPGVPMGSNKPTAALWKEIWSSHWPFGWMKDNFTKNLSGYYGYSRMSTSIAEMLIEFGEISCPEQDAWLQPRLEWIGSVVAHFAGRVIGADIPAPELFGGVEPPPDRAPLEIVKDPWDDDVAGLRLEVAELRKAVAALRKSDATHGNGSATRGTPIPIVDAVKFDEMDHEEWDAAMGSAATP